MKVTRCRCYMNSLLHGDNRLPVPCAEHVLNILGSYLWISSCHAGNYQNIILQSAEVHWIIEATDATSEWKQINKSLISHWNNSISGQGPVLVFSYPTDFQLNLYTVNTQFQFAFRAIFMPLIEKETTLCCWLKQMGCSNVSEWVSLYRPYVLLMTQTT